MGFGIKHGAKNLTRFVAKPTVSGAYTFDNSKKTATITGYDAKAMTISGTREATSAGTYSVTFTLNRGYAWTDKTKTPLTLTWSIAKRVLAIPYLSNKSYTWAVNATFKPTVNNFDSAYATQSGTVLSTSAGSWTVTWALRFTSDTTWSDGTTANKTDSWSVARLTLTKPSISGTKSFAFIEGTTRSVSVSGYNSTYETQSGYASASAQNTYTLTWALRYPANTQWQGGGTGNVTDSWSIVWVNGTSHYSGDYYNRGWNSGKINFNPSASLSYGTNTIVVNSDGSGAHFVINEAISGTFHVEVYVPSGHSSAYLYETNDGSTYSGSSWSDGGTGKTSVNDAWVEIYGAHKTVRKYFGAKVGTAINYQNGSQIRRIWVT